MTIHWKAVEYFTVVLFVDPLTPRVKPWVIQSFLTFDFMYRTLKCDHWKAVEQCFTVVLFDFQCYPVCNFGKFISFGLDTVRIERVKPEMLRGCLCTDMFCRKRVLVTLKYTSFKAVSFIGIVFFVFADLKEDEWEDVDDCASDSLDEETDEELQQDIDMVMHGGNNSINSSSNKKKWPQ